MESRLLKLESTRSIEKELSIMHEVACESKRCSILVSALVRASNNGEVTPTSVHALEEKKKRIQCRSSTIHSHVFVE